MKGLVKRPIGLIRPVLLAILGVGWSPAGWALEGTVLAIDAKAFKRGNLIMIDAAIGQRTTLVTGPCFGPCFSPDGTRIAYWRDSKIYTMKELLKVRALNNKDLVMKKQIRSTSIVNGANWWPPTQTEKSSSR